MTDPTNGELHESMTDWLRRQASVITHPLARQLHHWGIHANTITILGAILSCGVGVVLGSGRLKLGAVLLLLVSSLDAVDGALARVAGEKSSFGAFLDSTLDRISEGALFLGLLVWLLGAQATWSVIWAVVALLGSVMVSYARARAEGVGLACNTGLFTRVPRIVVLGVGTLAGWLHGALLVLAIGTWFTVAQRIWYVYRASRSAAES
ncbi:MAG: CDP-alcohol phosphatidyltransferase family protein [Anaerolineae bacterium]|nr:CDP-alcohol phosphatidyltransferase family protein [Anaerolineae bacterium]